MSCQPLWERVIELAEQAHKDALGADAATNVRNIELVRTELDKIDEQCGNATERSVHMDVNELENELSELNDEVDKLKGKLKLIGRICYE